VDAPLQVSNSHWMMIMALGLWGEIKVVHALMHNSGHQ
jgi:hypothetical protein